MERESEIPRHGRVIKEQGVLEAELDDYQAIEPVAYLVPSKFKQIKRYPITGQLKKWKQRRDYTRSPRKGL